MDIKEKPSESHGKKMPWGPIMLKRKEIIRHKIVSVGYEVIETKRLITYWKHAQKQ